MGKLDSFSLDNNRIDGGGGSGNAQPGDVLNGKTFTNDDGEQVGVLTPGKKFATGTVLSSSDNLFFIDISGNQSYSTYLTISGLDFVPSHITLYVVGQRTSISYDADYNFLGVSGANIKVDNSIYKVSGPAYVDSRGARLPTSSASLTYTFKAYE